MKRENSSLLKQKQEQWAREKETTSEWFPFGDNMTPGSGSPLRKFESKTPVVYMRDAEVGNEENEKVEDAKEHDEQLMRQKNSSSSGSGIMREGPEAKLNADLRTEERNPAQPPSTVSSAPASGYHNFAAQPFYAPYPYHHQFPHHQPPFQCPAEYMQPPPHHLWQPYQPYQPIPPSAVPVTTINIDPQQYAALQAMLAIPQGVDGIRYGIPINPNFVNNHPMTSSMSSDESGVSGVNSKRELATAQMELTQIAKDVTSDYNDEDPCVPLTRRSTMNSYEEQIAERNRFLKEEERRERLEMEEAERQRKELERRNEDEEEKRKRQEQHRIEEEQRRKAQYLSAMEKYRKEAEDMKKVRSQKHRLFCAQQNGNLNEVLKELDIDMDNGLRYLKEIAEIERHKKDDLQEIQNKSSQVLLRSNSARKSEEPQRARSSSISVSASSLTRNGFGRRSVRTTSREKSEMEKMRKKGEEEEEQKKKRLANNRDDDDRRLPILPSAATSAAARFSSSFELEKGGEEMRSKVYHPVDRTASSAFVYDSQQQQQQQCQNENENIDVERSKLFLRRSEEASSSSPATPTAINNVSTSRVLLQKEREKRPGAIDTAASSSTAFTPFNNSSVTPTGLFAPIPTRASIRRSNMRAPDMSPVGKEMKHENGFVKPRANSFETNEEMSSGGSLSPDLNHNDSVPSSTENMHPKVDVYPSAISPDFQKEYKLRTRSALGSPSNYLINGAHSNMNSRCASPSGNSRFLQKLDQKGALRREEDCLSPSVRRVAETNLSRSPSIASFSGSFQNLSQLRGSMMNLAAGGEPSANLSKFRSINSPARQSLNSRMQKTTDKQSDVLDRLKLLRDTLHSGKNFAPTRSSRIGSSNQTPPMSPARPL